VSTLREQVATYEATLIRAALVTHHQNRRATARALGISLRTLFYKLQLMGEPTPPRHARHRRTYEDPKAAGLFEQHFPSTIPCPPRDARAALLDDWWPGKLDVHCAYCKKELPVEKGASSVLTPGEYATVIPNPCPFCGKQPFVTAP
jgi:hypothetical protein